MLPGRLSCLRAAPVLDNFIHIESSLFGSLGFLHHCMLCVNEFFQDLELPTIILMSSRVNGICCSCNWGNFRGLDSMFGARLSGSSRHGNEYFIFDLIGLNTIKH